MPENNYINLTVSDRFFQPLTDAIENSHSTRACPQFSDAAFLSLGVQRVLSQSVSGRDFLQTHCDLTDSSLRVSTFFESLKSKRRLSLCAEVNVELGKTLDKTVDDPFVKHPELAEFEIFAGDGHYHASACHDEKKGGRKHPVGHFFLFNLRSQALFHMDTALNEGRRKREHDMHLLKRMTPGELRMNAPKGRKVLYVWDRAGVDFRFWHRCKTGNGVYFLSCEKENMKLMKTGAHPWNQKDPRNEGVIADEYVGSSCGTVIRRVTYFDAATSKTFKFLTNVFTVEPGLIALLYKCRWHIEKVFDQSKNKLEEIKAWATSHTAKSMQAQFICLTHNLLLLLEMAVEQDHGPINEREVRRRKKRLDAVKEKVLKQGGGDPFVHTAIQRLTVRSVRFIRWLRSQLQLRLPWDIALSRLRHAYDNF